MSLRTLGAIVGTIGAGMSGYARGKRDYESDQAYKEDRDFQKGQRARMVKYQGEEDTLRDTLKAAGSSGKSPAEVARAQSAAYTQAGKPLEAQQLADFADRMEKEGALAFIDANLQGLGEPGQEFALKGLDEFNAAGKIKAPPGAKGRSTRIKLPNGMEVNDFEVLDGEGKVVLPSARRVEAMYGYSRAQRDKQEREDFQHGQDTQFKRDTLDETRQFHRDSTRVAERNAATNAAAQQATAAYHARMAGVAEGKVGATAQQPGQLTLADLKDGHKAIASTLNADYKSQIDGAASPQDADPIKRTREAEIADVQRLYTGAMMAGMPLTPEQAIAAFRAGRRGMRKVPDSEGNVHAIEGMQVGDRFIPFAGQPGVTISNGPGGEANGQWDVPGRSTAPAPAPAAPAPRAAMAPPPYQPPAGSQAATMLQARAQAAASREEAKRATAAASEALAAAALQSADKRAALEAMRSDGYSMLPEATRVALYKLANSR